MGTPERRHYAVFTGPGDFISEASVSKRVSRWDVKEAMTFIKHITDFVPDKLVFRTYIECDPISDGEGDVLTVNSKFVEQSIDYFIGGKVETYDEVKNKGTHPILLLSMSKHKIWTIVSTSENRINLFDKNGVILDIDGNIVLTGDNKELVDYRLEKDKADLNE